MIFIGWLVFNATFLAIVFISSKAKVSEWCAAVKSHPSTSKNIVPYACLPTKEDVESGTLQI